MIKNSLRFVGNRNFLRNFYLKNRFSSEKHEFNLETHLINKIRLKGAISVADYMKEVLGNAHEGYYMNKDVFGQQGDFITSPEISQIFGELIGVWFVNEWMTLKRVYNEDMPEAISLIELGPGRGTLMSDVLRVLSKRDTLTCDLVVYLVETSPFLRKIQCKNLCNLNLEPKLAHEYEYTKTSDTKGKVRVAWIESISDLPHREAAHFFLANEFFDALPVYKFQKIGTSFKEVLIDYDDTTKKFKYVLAPKSTLSSQVFLRMHPNYEKFDHVEVSVESAKQMEMIVKRLCDYNGSSLIIDYGHDGQLKDTFRAFKSHELSNPLENIGQSDLTADVDFSFLKHICKKYDVACYGPITQSKFLSQMQIHKRLEMLVMKTRNASERKALIDQCDMLVNPLKMGERFKLLALRRFRINQPVPGFIETDSIFE